MKDRNKCCAFEDPWEDSSPQDRLEGERAERAPRFHKEARMSDDSKTERPGEQIEAADEVEGHAKLDAKLDAKTERPGVADDSDEVEAHKVASPKND